MNKWDNTLEIKRIHNGFILKGKFGDSEIVDEHAIIHENDDIYDKDIEFANNLSLTKRVLETIQEWMGTYYSKHNNRNISIIIEENKD